jgi:hypothetical protein
MLILRVLSLGVVARYNSYPVDMKKQWREADMICIHRGLAGVDIPFPLTEYFLHCYVPLKPASTWRV